MRLERLYHITRNPIRHKISILNVIQPPGTCFIKSLATVKIPVFVFSEGERWLSMAFFVLNSVINVAKFFVCKLATCNSATNTTKSFGEPSCKPCNKLSASCCELLAKGCFNSIINCASFSIADLWEGSIPYSANNFAISPGLFSNLASCSLSNEFCCSSCFNVRYSNIFKSVGS